jgi:hypothetical protein
MFYSSYIMSRARKSFNSNWQDKTVDAKGMQAPDLVVGYDHPAWDTLARRSAKDDEIERQVGEIEIDVSQMLALAEWGDPEAMRELGGAFLRVLEQRGVSFGPEMTAPGLENAGS